LVKYVGSGNAGSVDTGADKEKNTIYNLRTDDGNAKNFLSDRLSNYRKILQELWAYHEIVGLDTLEEVLKVHANGLVITQREATHSKAVSADLGNGTL